MIVRTIPNDPSAILPWDSCFTPSVPLSTPQASPPKESRVPKLIPILLRRDKVNSSSSCRKPEEKTVLRDSRSKILDENAEKVQTEETNDKRESTQQSHKIEEQKPPIPVVENSLSSSGFRREELSCPFVPKQDTYSKNRAGKQSFVGREKAESKSKKRRKESEFDLDLALLYDYDMKEALTFRGPPRIDTKQSETEKETLIEEKHPRNSSVGKIEERKANDGEWLGKRSVAPKKQKKDKKDYGEGKVSKNNREARKLKQQIQMIEMMEKKNKASVKRSTEKEKLNQIEPEISKNLPQKQQGTDSKADVLAPKSKEDCIAESDSTKDQLTLEVEDILNAIESGEKPATTLKTSEPNQVKESNSNSATESIYSNKEKKAALNPIVEEPTKPEKNPRHQAAQNSSKESKGNTNVHYNRSHLEVNPTKKELTDYIKEYERELRKKMKKLAKAQAKARMKEVLKKPEAMDTIYIGCQRDLTNDHILETICKLNREEALKDFGTRPSNETDEEDEEEEYESEEEAVNNTRYEQQNRD